MRIPALIILPALLIMLAVPAPALAVLDRIVAFGDSYSDNGAGYGITRAMAAHGVDQARAKPGDGYWQQRWSNGPVAVEVLAKRLGVPLADYAVGGATSGTGNYYDWMNRAQPTGTLAQVAAYLESRPDGQADSRALYVVFASANDFFAREDFDRPIAIDTLADQAAKHVDTAVQELADAGARHFLIVGSVNLAHVPAVVAQNNQSDGAAFAKRFDDRLKDKLARRARHTDLKISWFDTRAFTRRVRDRAPENGLTALDQPCRAVMVDDPRRCEDPASHFYWDEWHPTHHIHRLMGQAMAEALDTNSILSDDAAKTTGP